MLGTADISTLGEGADIGTVTGALSKLNSDSDSKLKKISVRDVSTYDPVTIIQNKWGSDINDTGCYFIYTSVYTYCVLVMYISPEYGTATIFGYALDTSAVNHGRMFNGTWHWDTLV